MNSMPPLNSLRCFFYAAKYLSFKKTAEELCVTQAAVSQQIQVLESFLETQLFIRLNRKVRLTEAGKLLQPFVERGFESLEQGVHVLTKQSDSESLLTISVLPSFASRWLVPRLGEFQEENPNLKVCLEPNKQLETFERGNVDLGIRMGTGDYEGLESHYIRDDYIYPVCSPSFFKQWNLQSRPTQPIPFLEDNGPLLSGYFEKFLADQQFERDQFEVVLSIPDSWLLIEAVLVGQGMALLRHTLIHQFLERGQIVRPFTTVFKTDIAYYLVAPKHHFQREKVIRFERWIKKSMESMFSNKSVQ